MTFDAVEASRIRNASIRRVDSSADEEWKAAALACVRAISLEFREFTTDETEALMILAYPNLSVHDGRAWGPVMRKAAKKGWVRATNRTEKSSMVSNHRRPKTVWQSLAWDK